MILRIASKILSLLFGQLKLAWLKAFNPFSLRYHFGDRISPFSNLSIMHGKIVFGKKCRVDVHSAISAVNGLVTFGNNCFVNRNCFIVAHNCIEIKNNVMIGPNVTILDHDHKIINGSVKKNAYDTRKVTIEDGAWIGANSVILKGVTIGKNAVVAAGSIVTHDCPANSVLIQKRKTEFVEMSKK